MRLKVLNCLVEELVYKFFANFFRHQWITFHNIQKSFNLGLPDSFTFILIKSKKVSVIIMQIIRTCHFNNNNDAKL